MLSQGVSCFQIPMEQCNLSHDINAVIEDHSFHSFFYCNELKVITSIKPYHKSFPPDDEITRNRKSQHSVCLQCEIQSKWAFKIEASWKKRKFPAKWWVTRANSVSRNPVLKSMEATGRQRVENQTFLIDGVWMDIKRQLNLVKTLSSTEFSFWSAINDGVSIDILMATKSPPQSCCQHLPAFKKTSFVVSDFLSSHASRKASSSPEWGQ